MIIDILLFYCEGRGGVEDVTTKISNGLIAKGHRVRVFQAYKPQYDEWGQNLVEFYFYAGELSWNSYIGDYADNYNKIIDKIGKPDVMLVTHEPFCNNLCYLALNKNKKEHTPLISWIHFQVSGYARSPEINYSDVHLAISKGVQDSLCTMFNPSNIYLVGNPITTTGLSVCKRPKEKLSLLFVGRLVNPQKRLDVIFNALADVKGPWNLKIIGTGPDQDMLMNMANILNISSNIEWLGWKTNPWDEVKEASALLLTSDYEGFGLVTVEALARGIPVISTKTAGATEILSNNENGWLIDIGDSNQLANLLNKIQGGSLQLPSSEKCIESIKRYDEFVVTDKIEKVLINEYNKNKNKKLIDFLLLDKSYTEETTATILNVYKELISRGHRVRFFQPFHSTISKDTDIIAERYIYASELSPYCSIDECSIVYKKLLFQVGKPEVTLIAHNTEFNYFENDTLKDIKFNIPILSLTNLIKETNSSMNYKDDEYITSIVDIMESLLKKTLEERSIN